MYGVEDWNQLSFLGLALGLLVHWVSIPVGLLVSSAMHDGVKVKGAGPALRVGFTYPFLHLLGVAALAGLYFLPVVGWLLAIELVRSLALFFVSVAAVRFSTSMVRGVTVSTWKAASFITLISAALGFVARWLLF